MTSAEVWQTRQRHERLTRAQQKEHTRRLLLDAARSVVARRGMSAASHEEIASEAGLTIGAIYSNFANKADFMVSLIEDGATSGTPLFEARPTIRESLEWLGRRLATQVDSEPELTDLSLEFMLFEIRNPEARKRRMPARAAEHAAFAQLLEAMAAESGETLPMSAAELAEVISNLGWSLACSRRVLGPAVMSGDLMARALAALIPVED